FVSHAAERRQRSTNLVPAWSEQDNRDVGHDGHTYGWLSKPASALARASQECSDANAARQRESGGGGASQSETSSGPSTPWSRRSANSDATCGGQSRRGQIT